VGPEFRKKGVQSKLVDHAVLPVSDLLLTTIRTMSHSGRQKVLVLEVNDANVEAKKKNLTQGFPGRRVEILKRTGSGWF